MINVTSQSVTVDQASNTFSFQSKNKVLSGSLENSVGQGFQILQALCMLVLITWQHEYVTNDQTNWFIQLQLPAHNEFSHVAVRWYLFFPQSGVTSPLWTTSNVSQNVDPFWCMLWSYDVIRPWAKKYFGISATWA